jgi:sRNA-binding carbon storage regulator CsrA
VLTRAKDEEVVIRVPPSNKWTEIVVAALEFEKIEDPVYREIRLGFDAPHRVTINRAEIQNKIDQGVP